MEIIISCLLVALMISPWVWMIVNRKKTPPSPPPPPIDLSPIHRSIGELTSAVQKVQKDLTQVPRKTMKTLEGATNVNKGAYAEWNAFHSLCRTYDKVVFFGTVFDFMCVRFEQRGDEPAGVDFIDVKSGRASLSKDQRRLRDLIKEGKIDFKTVRVKVD